MKKIKLFLTLLLFGVIITGCEMKYDIDMAITETGEVDLEIIIAYDKELISGLMSMENTNLESTEETEEPTEEEMKEWLKETIKEDTTLGVKMEEYAEGEFLGYKISATQNIEELVSDNEVIYDFTNNEETEKMFTKEGNVYKAKMSFDPNELMEDEETGEETEEDLSGYMDMITLNYTFTVTLPNKPLKHNATNVSSDGKTLTWNMSTTEISSIEFEFELDLKDEEKEENETGTSKEDKNQKEKNFLKEYETELLIGAGVLIAIILITTIIIKSRKPKTPVEEKVETKEVIEEKVEVINEPTTEIKEEITEQTKEEQNAPTTEVSEPNEENKIEKE